jgi:amino-acid N-acetyltransferase
VTIEPAATNDGPAILELLSRSELPIAGLIDHLNTALVARVDGRIVGCVAVELYPDGALLRSVAVDAAARNNGIGHRLIESALEMIRRGGPHSVYLLTTTAEDFFPRFGFRQIQRTDVPIGVQQSVEFRSACPASAIVMVKERLSTL